MAQQVSPAMYYELDGQLSEIKRQIRQPAGYPFDANELKDALQSIIEGRFKARNTNTFPIWRTITIGGVSRDKLMRWLLDDRFLVSSLAKETVSKPVFTILSEPIDIRLVRTKIKDLGFKREPTTTELFTRIEEVGDLCQAEVVLHLRLADTDQPEGTWYWIPTGLRTIIFSASRHSDGWCCLDAHHIHSKFRWTLDSFIVFRSCR